MNKPSCRFNMKMWPVRARNEEWLNVSTTMFRKGEDVILPPTYSFNQTNFPPDKHPTPVESAKIVATVRCPWIGREAILSEIVGYGFYDIVYAIIEEEGGERAARWWIGSEKFLMDEIIELYSRKGVERALEFESPFLRRWNNCIKYFCLPYRRSGSKLYNWKPLFFMTTGIVDFRGAEGVVPCVYLSKSRERSQVLAFASMSDDSIQLREGDSFGIKDGDDLISWSRRMRPSWDETITARDVDDAFENLFKLIDLPYEIIAADSSKRGRKGKSSIVFRFK